MSQSFIRFTCCADGIPYYNAHFGAGTGPIFLDDVACSSSASQLLECSSRPILQHNCAHSADAGVGCKGTSIHKEHMITGNFGTPSDAFQKWIINSIFMQLPAQLVSCNWWEEVFQMKEEWRSVYSVVCGALCVMIPGAIQMLLWCVDS